MLTKLKQAAQRLTSEISALSLACRDPRVPWYAKAIILCVVAYAISPIDLIPDPIPVLGYLDDLVLLPLGIALALKLIPPDVMEDCRSKVLDQTPKANALAWTMAGVIILFWVGLVVAAYRVGKRVWISG